MPSSAPQIPAERPWPEIELTRQKAPGSRLRIAAFKQAPGFERETYVPVSTLAAFKERLLSDEAVEAFARRTWPGSQVKVEWDDLDADDRQAEMSMARDGFEAALASIERDGGGQS